MTMEPRIVIVIDAHRHVETINIDFPSIVDEPFQQQLLATKMLAYEAL